MKRKTMLKCGFVTGVTTAILCLGCEQESKAPEKKPEGPAKSNIDAIKEATSSPVRPVVTENNRGSNPLPAGHPPIDQTSARNIPATSAPGNIPAPPLPNAGDPKWDVPKDFVETPPGNAMRRAQYKLPRAEGDPEDGEIIVNYFGPGQGGNLTANLERWRGQFSNSDGSPLADEAVKTETFDAGKLKVTLLDVSGRMSGGGMTPGAPATGPKDNFRMLAAMVETSRGPWFFKCTGPQKTIEKHAESIKTMLKSVRE